ncbi:MAG: TRAP transporter small permease [Rhodobacteraceae bacterium]|nr:TRAP transporter small permease [Paracoccaceae bacterium]
MKRMLNAVDALIGGIITVLFVIALGLALMGVIGRYVSSQFSLDWIEEITIFIIIWANLLGAARIARRGTHIRVDFLFDRFSAQAQRWATLFALTLAIGISGFLVWSGWQVVTEAMMWDERTISTLRTPMWIFYLALSVSFALQIVFLLERAVDVSLGHETMPQTEPELPE